MAPANPGTRPGNTENADLGLADAFPAYSERIIPGADPYRAALMVAPVRKVEVQKVQPAQNNSGFVAGLKRLFANRTTVNIIVLIVLALLFVLYRLRSGRDRYS